MKRYADLPILLGVALASAVSRADPPTGGIRFEAIGYESHRRSFPTEFDYKTCEGKPVCIVDSLKGDPYYGNIEITFGCGSAPSRTIDIPFKTIERPLVLRCNANASPEAWYLPNGGTRLESPADLDAKIKAERIALAAKTNQRARSTGDATVCGILCGAVDSEGFLRVFSTVSSGKSAG